MTVSDNLNAMFQLSSVHAFQNYGSEYTYYQSYYNQFKQKSEMIDFLYFIFTRRVNFDGGSSEPTVDLSKVSSPAVHEPSPGSYIAPHLRKK